MKKPIWTNDWACHHYESWRKYLGKFADIEAHALEIGSCEGRSTCFFVQHILCHENSTMTCVDPFIMSKEESFWHNVDALNCRDKINLLRMESDKAKLDFKMWDFVYIDGNHSARHTLTDAVRAWVSVRKGGVMIFDDVLWRMNELQRRDCPKMGIDIFLNIYEKEMKILHLGHQAIIEKV